MDVNEAVSVVIAYIHHRKEVIVNINMNQFQHPMNLVRLQQAYTYAMQWFQSNGGRIEMIYNK